MFEALQHSFTHALAIAGFVFGMMFIIEYIIEYINVLSRGVWQESLRDGKGRQYILAAFLEAIPGCPGVFAVVSLYFHQLVSPGALVAAIVANSDNESFVMLAMAPKTAMVSLPDSVSCGYCGWLSRRPIGEKLGCRDTCFSCFGSA